MRSGRRYFLYRMSVDNGLAPCCTPRLLSLALARPAVRRNAERGDVLIGVASTQLDREHGLIYLARVTARVPGPEYFAAAGPYAGRADCSDRVRQTNGEGSPPARAPPPAGTAGYTDVLLSREFRYFGASRSALPRELYPNLRALLEAHGHGLRRHGAGTVSAELEGLMLGVFAAFPDAINGKPTHRAAPRADPGDDLDVVEG